MSIEELFEEIMAAGGDLQPEDLTAAARRIDEEGLEELEEGLATADGLPHSLHTALMVVARFTVLAYHWAQALEGLFERPTVPTEWEEGPDGEPMCPNCGELHLPDSEPPLCAACGWEPGEDTFPGVDLDAMDDDQEAAWRGASMAGHGADGDGPRHPEGPQASTDPTGEYYARQAEEDPGTAEPTAEGLASLYAQEGTADRGARQAALEIAGALGDLAALVDGLETMDELRGKRLENLRRRIDVLESRADQLVEAQADVLRRLDELEGGGTVREEIAQVEAALEERVGKLRESVDKMASDVVDALEWGGQGSRRLDRIEARLDELEGQA